jgi:RNA polymerase sigma-70 factor (ECF subfamily)
MDSRMELTDGAFVARVRAGDTDAFRLLVERHSRRLFHLAFRMTGNEQDAEDVVQESFLRAYRRLSQFDERSSFGTWLYRIAANCSIDLVRSKGQKYQQTLNTDDNELEDPMATLRSSDPSPERSALSAEVRDRVAEAMKELSPVERTAFVLRHFEGMRLEEVGRTLGCQTNAAKHSVFRAVQKLRRALEPLACPSK